MGHDGYLNQCKWLKNSVYYDVDDFYNWKFIKNTLFFT